MAYKIAAHAAPAKGLRAVVRDTRCRRPASNSAEDQFNSG
jgi:hypothetical protein